jgi:hypothetical protein
VTDISTDPVLYIVSCAAPPTRRIETLITLAQTDGWDTCLVLTPSAARWRADDLDTLTELTGHPVRSEYKRPEDPDALPDPTAFAVCPATFNTLNKWALGISDTLVLGLLTEALGLGRPIVALPYLNAAQARHPALSGSVRVLRGVGVKVLLGDGGFVPHEPKQGKLDEYPWGAVLDALEPA